MSSGENSSRNYELSPDIFSGLTQTLDEHVQYASSQNVATSISLQNGIRFEGNTEEHEVVELGEQRETFAASHAKLAVVAFKLAQGPISPDDKRDILSMLRISDNGAFIRQKRHIAPEVVSFAKTEIGIETDILTVRNNGTSYSGQTTARDSLKLFIKTVQLARNSPDIAIANDLHDAMSQNTSRYGVRARIVPHSGLNLLNKTGDYYGQDDPDIGEAVHHDAGILYIRGSDKRRLAYSITSSADSRLGALKADWLNQLAAKTLIEALGGKPKSALGAVASKLLTK